MKRILLGSVAAILAFSGSASAEGYVSGSYMRNDTAGGADIWSINARYLMGQNVLLDGGYSNAEGDSVIRVGGHVFMRNEQWLLGGYAGYQNTETSTDVDEWTLAAEGQYYLDRATIGAVIAYGEADNGFLLNDINQWRIGAGVRYFVTDNFDLEGNVAWVQEEFDPIGFSEDGAVIDIGAEYQFDGAPVSVFAGYRNTDLLFSSSDAWSIGLRWNFGEGTLMQRDRSGARLRRPEGVVETFVGGVSPD